MAYRPPLKRARLLGQYGTNPYMRAAIGTGALVARAAPYAKKAFSAIRTLTQKRSTIEPAPNTFQNDAQMRYRKKRMPKRKRRRWVRFVKRVRHVDLAMQPLQIYTKEGTVNLTSAANQGQVWSRMLGGMTVANNDEILQVFKSAYNLSTEASCAPYKIYLKSICMDVQMTNTGSYPIIVDMYTLVCRKTWDTAEDIGASFVNALGEIQAPAGGGSLTSSKTALTLFDAPNFCEFWRIQSKKEFIIGGSNTITVQLRNPANRYFDGKEIISNAQAKPGFTKAFFFMWHGQPSNRGAAGASQFDATTVTFGYQTVVHYAVPPGSKTTEAGKTD